MSIPGHVYFRVWKIKETWTFLYLEWNRAYTDSVPDISWYKQLLHVLLSSFSKVIQPTEWQMRENRTESPYYTNNGCIMKLIWPVGWAKTLLNVNFPKWITQSLCLLLFSHCCTLFISSEKFSLYKVIKVCYIFIALCSFQNAFTFLISCDLGKNFARLCFILILYQSGKGSSKRANNKINLCMTQTLENVELCFFFPPFQAPLQLNCTSWWVKIAF